MPHPAPSSESEFNTANAYYVQTPPTEREGEKWQHVCSHATPCAVIVKMSDLSLLSLLSLPPLPLSPPALYLLMDPFNYLLHILGRQQARAEYTGWR